jgi:predicted CXXCH cytochrome family protein
MGVAISVMFFVADSNVSALLSPHTTPYPVDTDACAQCHRLHTGAGNKSTTTVTQKDQCLACHNGTGSVFNVDVSFNKSNRHSIGGKDPGSTKQCATCHEVHIADPGLMGLLMDPGNTHKPWVTVESSSTAYDSSVAPSGLYVWCETCHKDSTQMPPGTTILKANNESTSYVPYDVQVVSWTSYDEVDDNGDTTGFKFWQYFLKDTISTTILVETTATPASESTNTSSDATETATGESTAAVSASDSNTATSIPDSNPAITVETTETHRYGYNDATAIGNAAHGRAVTSDNANKGFFEWMGPYKADYPALSCKNCHDHHGSNQPWMIVDSITVGDTETAGYDMRTPQGQLKFCESCHVGTYWNCDIRQKCTNCHRHGQRF